MAGQSTVTLPEASTASHVLGLSEGSTVRQGLADLAAQVLAYQAKFDTDEEFQADGRPDEAFSEGEYVGIGGPSGYTMQKVSSGEDRATDGGSKWRVMPGPAGYNVKAFEAKGDDSTDDDAALLAAFARASGNSLHFPRGSYRSGSGAINLTADDIEITASNGAEIVYDAAGTFEGLLRINASNITISRLKFRNSYEAGTVSQIGVDIETGSHIKLLDCEFDNFRYCVLGRTDAEWVTVRGGRINTGPQGLTGIVLNGRHNRVTDVNIEFFGDTAIGVTGGSFDSIITGNQIAANPTYASLGIIIEKDAENAIVMGNQIDGMYEGTVGTGLQTGIKIGDDTTGVCPKGVIVALNIVKRCATYGSLALNSVSYSGAAISGVTNAFPAVVETTSAHGLSDRDVVTIDDVVGMEEINERSARIVVLTDTTFEMVGVDSSNFGTYASGGTWDEWREPTDIIFGFNIYSGCGSNGLRLVNARRVVDIGNISSDNEGSGVYQQAAKLMAMLGNISSGNGTNGFNSDNASFDAMIGNISQGNGTDYNHTRPSFLGAWANNLGWGAGQHEGGITEVRRKVSVTASSTEYFDLVMVPDQARFIMLDAYCYTSSAGATDASVNIVTNSNLGGELSGTVNHGNEEKSAAWENLATADNNFGTDKYVRVGVKNDLGSDQECFVTVRYRMAGGT